MFLFLSFYHISIKLLNDLSILCLFHDAFFDLSYTQVASCLNILNQELVKDVGKYILRFAIPSH